jgi:hypothetical protein
MAIQLIGGQLYDVPERSIGSAHTWMSPYMQIQKGQLKPINLSAMLGAQQPQQPAPPPVKPVELSPVPQQGFGGAGGGSGMSMQEILNGPQFNGSRAPSAPLPPLGTPQAAAPQPAAMPPINQQFAGAIQRSLPGANAQTMQNILGGGNG